MRVIYTSKGMSKKFGGARYLSKNTVFGYSTVCSPEATYNISKVLAQFFPSLSKT
jgi:hypothetical protein